MRAFSHVVAFSHIVKFMTEWCVFLVKDSQSHLIEVRSSHVKSIDKNEVGFVHVRICRHPVIALDHMGETLFTHGS